MRCGFFLARATTATAAFFSEVAERTRICGDDQVAVNETLVAKGIAWEDAVPSEWRSHRGKPFRTFPEAITGHAPTLRVALLPHRRFPRLPEVSPETVVAHPLVARADGISTTQRLSADLGRLGLWGPVDAPRAAPEDAPHN